MKKALLGLMSVLVCGSAYALKIDGNKIIDNRGNKIENKVYNKIVILDPSVVEGFYMIGGEGKIVAIADTARSPIWPVEKTKDIPKAGTINKPSIEQVLSYEPELVILNPMSEGFADSLKARGLKYIVNEGKTFDEILNNLEIYGEISGAHEKATIISKEYKEKLASVKEEISKKPLNIKGAFVFSTSPMMAFTEKSLPGEIFTTLGIENIASGLPGGRPILSPEYLISKNPDLLVGSMSIKNKNDIINSNPFVKQTKAGQNGNVLVVDSSKILRPTPRIIDALDELYEELANAK